MFNATEYYHGRVNYQTINAILFTITITVLM